jgi:hypothetical protein
MKQSDIFRENAENCRHLAEHAEGQPAHKRYMRMAEAWMALANEQDWLDGEVPPAPIVASPAENYPARSRFLIERDLRANAFSAVVARQNRYSPPPSKCRAGFFRIML